MLRKERGRSRRRGDGMAERGPFRISEKGAA
jgi:hypothetical protein